MPRPRVQPADRSRAAKACITCKSSKKRCDAKLPCLQCVKKGRAESCKYPDDRGQHRTRSPQRSSLSRHSLVQQTPVPPRETENWVDIPQQRLPISSIRPSTRDESYAETRDSSPQRGQRSTMLRNSRGEQVYIGNIAALSFLHFLQKTLKRYIGSSVFTERQRNETMLEAEIQDGTPEFFEDDLDITQKQDLIKCFMRTSNGILHLFSEQDISRLLNLTNTPAVVVEHSSQPSHREDLACLYLLIAIGAQCRGNDQAEIQVAKKFFARAQHLAFVGMLQEPSVCMVKIFLMMAMYMLGACRRNTAFMYIGIASKAATILGLHVPYQHVRASLEERAARRRIWMSLRVLDLLCSSILARPSSIPSIQRDEFEIDDAGHAVMDHRTLAICANYESSSIIDSIVQAFSKTSMLDVPAAEHYLTILREWSQALPDALRTSPKCVSSNVSPDTDPRETTIGNIHVACTYYFGVIIVTRQFLVSRVMTQLRSSKNGTIQPLEMPNPEVGEEYKHLQFSNACISSAVYMVQLCYDASTSSILLDNMFILKAWLFSAGLVLGFSLLMDAAGLDEIQDAFDHARDVLHKLARLSPQAEQYHTILTNFSAAITLYRKQLQMQQKHISNIYVSKITTIENNNNNNHSNEQQNGTGDNAYNMDQSQLPTPGPFTGMDIQGGITGDGMEGDLANLDFTNAGQNEFPDFTTDVLNEIWNDIGVGADLRWLCYAAS